MTVQLRPLLDTIFFYKLHCTVQFLLLTVATFLAPRYHNFGKFPDIVLQAATFLFRRIVNRDFPGCPFRQVMSTTSSHGSR
uniref:Uncharacterized protein n=1 Tax=Setaria italica TaxID=4555 RepID=K3ZYM7_SETIT